jgi:hypothetical protein
VTAVHIPTNHEIETFTGRFVDTHDPRAETICIEDVAHGLANTCRYGGQCRRFYSVAEHAVLCAWYAAEREWDVLYQLACLHHDDAEAYLGDIPRPMKSLLGDAYRDMTISMDAAIGEALNLPFPVQWLHSAEVREADNWALMREAHVLLRSRGRGWSGQQHNWDVDLENTSGLEAPDYFAFGLRPGIAEGLWLQEHARLLEEL